MLGGIHGGNARDDVFAIWLLVPWQREGPGDEAKHSHILFIAMNMNKCVLYNRYALANAVAMNSSELISAYIQCERGPRCNWNNNYKRVFFQLGILLDSVCTILTSLPVVATVIVFMANVSHYSHTCVWTVGANEYDILPHNGVWNATSIQCDICRLLSLHVHVLCSLPSQFTTVSLLNVSIKIILTNSIVWVNVFSGH